MRARVAVVALTLVGCYRDPDYSQTQFRCDAAQACPVDQVCVAGNCLRPVATACGALTCAPLQICCVIAGTPSCRSSPAGCSLTASCDASDSQCGDGTCCSTPQGASCGSSCPVDVCETEDDCFDAALPMCCPVAGAPWLACGNC